MEDSTNLLDYHNRLTANILNHFVTLCRITTTRATAATPNIASTSLAGMSMDLEFKALTTAIKDLLNLSRRIKELWVFGALGRQGEGGEERVRRVEENVRRVAKVLTALEEGGLKGVVEGAGGQWNLVKEGGVKEEGH